MIFPSGVPPHRYLHLSTVHNASWGRLAPHLLRLICVVCVWLHSLTFYCNFSVLLLFLINHWRCALAESQEINKKVFNWCACAGFECSPRVEDWLQHTSHVFCDCEAKGSDSRVLPQNKIQSLFVPLITSNVSASVPPCFPQMLSILICCFPLRIIKWLQYKYFPLVQVCAFTLILATS